MKKLSMYLTIFVFLLANIAPAVSAAAPNTDVSAYAVSDQVASGNPSVDIKKSAVYDTYATKLQTWYKEGETINTDDVTLFVECYDGTILSYSGDDIVVEEEKGSDGEVDSLKAYYKKDKSIYSSVSIYVDEFTVYDSTKLDWFNANKKCTVYNVGDTLNTDDVCMMALAGDGTWEKVSADDYTVDTSNVNMDTEGSYNMKVTYTGDDAEYEYSNYNYVKIQVVKKRALVNSLRIYYSGECYAGEALNADLVVIEANYGDYDTIRECYERWAEIPLADCTSNFDELSTAQTGVQTLNVTYTLNGATATGSYEIEVEDRYVVLAEKTKVVYEVGDAVDVSDLSVKVLDFKQDGGWQTITTGYTTNVASLSTAQAGTQSLLISYIAPDGRTYTDTVEISVMAKPTPVSTTPTTMSPTTGTTSESNSESATKPAKAKGLKIKANKKKAKLTITWKKVKNAKKYQVQICAKKNFKTGVKNFSVKGLKKVYSTKKLKENKTYYVRVRAIGTSDSGSWSAVKKVKVR